MVFYDGTNKQGIVQDTLFTLFNNSADNSQYPTADITRNVNRRYDEVVALILDSDGRWQWDDTNATDLPIGTTNLVLNQQDYALDLSVLKVLRVECQDSFGNMNVLIPIDEADIYDQALNTYMQTPGNPRYYDKTGTSIILYPAPNFNATAGTNAGLKVYFQRNVSYFVPTDTTKLPGFASPFHRYLSLGAAIDFMTGRNFPQLPDCEVRLEKIGAAIQNFYAKRDKDEPVKFRVRKTIWR